MDLYLAEKNNETDLVVDQLEALQQPWRALLIILYSATALLAFCENLIVIIVQVFGSRFELVIRKCLINLAVSDVILGVLTVPFTYTNFMLGQWIFWDFMCPLSQFILLVSVCVTTSTLTYIGIERYMAIVHPLTHQNDWSQYYCNLILILSWIFGGIVGSLALYHKRSVEFHWNNETYFDCRFEDFDKSHELIYVVALFILTFVLPLFVQCICYGCIGWKLFKTRDSQQVDKIKAFKMLLAMVILFALCWLPIKVFILITVFEPDFFKLETETDYYVYVGSYLFCHWLSMFNSCINPILYGFMSNAFRDDLNDVFQKMCSFFNRKNSVTAV